MRRLSLIPAAMLGVFFSAGTAFGAAVGMDWTTGTTGDLNGTTVTMSNFLSASIGTFDLSGAPYSAAPLTANTETGDYQVGSDWTATFSQPVSNLLLYTVFWRGIFGGANPVDYMFDQPFTILSGLGAATVSSTTLSLPDTGFHNGIIQFTGPITSLSLTNNSNGGSFQALTFGVEMAAPVPEPSTVVLMGVGLVGLGYAARRKRMS